MTRAIRLLLVLLLVALPSHARAAVVTAPAAPVPVANPVVWHGRLILDIVRAPYQGHVCVNEEFWMFFQVTAADREWPMPVPDAMVDVRDDAGNVRAKVTSSTGEVGIPWRVTKAGMLTLTVSVAKTDWTSPPPQTLKYDVQPCEWLLDVRYHEEHAIIAEVDMVVGADVRWTGRLRVSSVNGDSQVASVEVLGGDGTYTFYASDKIKAPFHVSVDPAVSGTWGLRGDGTMSNGQVRLNVGETEEQYPEMVYLKLTDYTGNIQVHYKPPAPYINGKGMFLSSNRLNNLVLPATGGSITLDNGMATYFSTPDRTSFSISVTLTPYHNEASSPERVAAVGWIL